MNERARKAAPWVVLILGITGLVVYRPEPREHGGSAPHRLPAPEAAPLVAPPTVDTPLPGGGTSLHSRCGEKGFHLLPQPPPEPERAPDRPVPGPRLTLGSYGSVSEGAHDPGRFEIGLLLAAGPGGTMDLPDRLAPQGVVVEIEGPDGLVGGGYGLRVEFGEGASRSPEGHIRLGPDAASGIVVLPAEALCAGHDLTTVTERLMAPVDAHNTAAGRPPYTLTVSFARPAVGELRREARAPVRGEVLSADNRMDFLNLPPSA
ncbi:hypothetical protein [Kitasatospora sp. NPDC051914]|uniref:hypothetical protein n=1 Tax=Kitasatospora sp. NPDC051914 TaxID=3154945 RepID=UPI00341F3F55